MEQNIFYNNSPLMDLDFLKKLYIQDQKEVYAKIISLNWDEESLEEVSGVVTQGSVNVDGNSAVRRTCSLSMIVKNQDITDENWVLKTKFKLYVGLINNIQPEYPNIIWFPLGLFLINSFNKQKNSNSYTISINGKDKMALLDGTLGGVITASSVDFGVLRFLDTKTNITTMQKLKLKDIIKEVVHEYAREPFHNIVVEDLDTDGLELLEYRGTDPLYLLNLKQENEIYNISLDGKTKVWFEDSPGHYEQITLDSEKIIYDHRISSLMDSTQDITTVYIDKNRKIACSVIKLEYGDTAGYRVTDLVYAGDLIASVGNSITSSVLDKIKQMLGEYEYFYDLYGKFVFRKKATYINTSWTPNEGAYIENNMYEFPYEYSFTNNEIISAFSTNPDIANIKNDFSIWGTRKGVTGADLPVHLRFAINKRPEQYTTFGDITYIADDNVYSVSDDGKTIHCDWRELIYQMSLDYSKYNHEDDDFLAKLAMRNPKHYPTGLTGYELYYTDLNGFWRQLYNPQAVWEPSQTRSLGVIKPEDLIPASSGKIGEEKTNKWADVRAINTMQKIENTNIDEYDIDKIYRKFTIKELEEMSYTSNSFYDIKDAYFRHPLVSNLSYSIKNGNDINIETPSFISITNLRDLSKDGYLTLSYKYSGTGAHRPQFFIEQAKINKNKSNYLAVIKMSIVDASNSNKNKIFYLGLTKGSLEGIQNGSQGQRIYFESIQSNIEFVLLELENNNFKRVEEGKYSLEGLGFGEKVKIIFSSIFENNEEVFILNYVSLKEIKIGLDYNRSIQGEDISNSNRIYANVYDAINVWSDIYDVRADDGNTYKYNMYYKDYNNNFQEVRKDSETRISFDMINLPSGGGVQRTPMTLEDGAAWGRVVLSGPARAEEEWYTIYGINSETGDSVSLGSFLLPKRGPGNRDTIYTATFTYSGIIYVEIQSQNSLGISVTGIKKIKFENKTEFFNYLSINKLDKNNLYYSIVGESSKINNLNYFAKELVKSGNAEFYYLDINNWQDLKVNKEYTLLGDQVLPFNNYLTFTFDNYGAWIGGNCIPILPELRIARYNEVDEFHINYASEFYGWHTNVVENPSQLNFWFDFLDTGGSIDKFATYNIGNRPKAVNDTKVKAIYFKEVPNIIYDKDTSRFTDQEWTGYTKVSVAETLEEMFSSSSQGKSAKDVLDEFLYNNTYAIENVSITSVPIYTLQPNTRIKIEDDKENLNNEYVVSKLTIPLSYNGTMSITANKLAESIL